jgi:hypothetical protein
VRKCLDLRLVAFRDMREIAEMILSDPPEYCDGVSLATGEPSDMIH